MSEGFTESSRKEAEQIMATLIQLDKLLASNRLSTVYASEATDLRATVSDLLVRFRTNLENLAEVDRADVFKTDPTLANRRFVLIGNIEAAKTVYETQVLPDLDRMTARVIEQAKAGAPASLDVSGLPPAPSGERWTVQKVVDTAERLLNQGTKAVQVAAKGYAMVKALGLLVGIAIP